MTEDNSRIQSMLFDYGTTNRTDYRPYILKAPILTEYKEKPSSRSKTKQSPLRNLHTLTDWKTVGIPFNVLHRPRPVTGENPHIVQRPYFKPKDEGLRHAIETRPRLIMTPAIGLDDIEDQKVRDILIEDIYTSNTAKCQKETMRPYFRVAAPYPGLPAPANPIILPKLVPPVVSPEWRKETVEWDGKQLRAYCDSTKRFWLSRDIPKCRACDQSHQARAHAKRMCQMNQERQLTKV